MPREVQGDADPKDHGVRRLIRALLLAALVSGLAGCAKGGFIKVYYDAPRVRALQAEVDRLNQELEAERKKKPVRWSDFIKLFEID